MVKLSATSGGVKPSHHHLYLRALREKKVLKQANLFFVYLGPPKESSLVGGSLIKQKIKRLEAFRVASSSTWPISQLELSRRT